MAVLKQTEGGTLVPDICRQHGISSATFYKWRSKFGGMDVSLMAKMKELKDENDEIGSWLLRLTDNNRDWGFDLYDLYLRNVKQMGAPSFLLHERMALTADSVVRHEISGLSFWLP